VSLKTRPASLFSGCSLLAVALLFTAASAQEKYAVPDQIKPPADQRLVLQSHAAGVQIYVCQPTLGGDAHLAWVFSAPEATLTDDRGMEVAKHFAGPTWQSTDGSLVKGKVVSQASPDPESVPWLLLTAVDHSGAGLMSDVQTIQRLNTKGGKAPTTGCDLQHQGEKARVNYTADYNFYAPAK
jgi:hypothetical protein